MHDTVLTCEGETLISLSSSRPQTCEYGDNCPRAHCKEELREWKMRAAEKKQIRQNIEAQGLMTYNEKILEEYRNSTAVENIVSVKYVSDYSFVLSLILVVTDFNMTSTPVFTTEYSCVQACKTCHQYNCGDVFHCSSLNMSMMSESPVMLT